MGKEKVKRRSKVRLLKKKAARNKGTFREVDFKEKVKWWMESNETDNLVAVPTYTGKGAQPSTSGSTFRPRESSLPLFGSQRSHECPSHSSVQELMEHIPVKTDNGSPVFGRQSVKSNDSSSLFGSHSNTKTTNRSNGATNSTVAHLLPASVTKTDGECICNIKKDRKETLHEDKLLSGFVKWQKAHMLVKYYETNYF